MSNAVDAERATAPFHSILFDGTTPADGLATPAARAMYHDLNLDQIIDSVTHLRQGYDLEPFFHQPLQDADEVEYRHEVLCDLDDSALAEHVNEFAQQMRLMRERTARAGKSHYRQQKSRWQLAAVSTYVDAVAHLGQQLEGDEMTSRGFTGLREHLTRYVASDAFAALADETAQLERELADVRYCLDIKANRIKVTRYHDEIDYSADVAGAFEKFRQGAVKDYRIKYKSYDDMDHVEGGVLELVAKLFPDLFDRLEQFAGLRREFVDAIVARFDCEVQFYLAYLDYIAPLKARGLPFCLPQVSGSSKTVRVSATFDLALGAKLVAESVPVVCNDLRVEDAERIIVVSGPNQGGKTTFARTFGQLHYLAELGLPVPGKDAQLYLCDQILTHFERGENLDDLVGKLQDDLLRVHEILELATPDSVVILNEVFNSTALDDALYLSKQVLERLIQMDLLAVCVTFLDELASLSTATVSMVSTVDPDDSAVRTFKLVRKPADGRAYAMAIAQRYELSYQQLKDRVTR